MGAYVFFIHIAGDAVALPVVGFLSDRYGLRSGDADASGRGSARWALLLISVRDRRPRHGARQEVGAA